MSFTLRAKRVLVGAAAGAMVLGLMPTGAAFADDAVCDNAPGGVFTDAGATHGDNIHCMNAYTVPDDSPVFAGDPIILGRTASTFEPFGDLTRGQAATLLVKFALVATQGGVVDLLDGEAPEFSDVEGTTHAPAIGIIADLGLILGFPDGTFRPNDPMSRAAFATVLYNAHVALGVPFADEYDNPFTDIDRFEIAALAGEGVISGRTATTFDPWAPQSRGAAASLLKASADVLDSIDAWLAPRLPGPDAPILPNETFTAAPELVSVTKGAAGVVTFEFDEPVPGIQADPDFFVLYAADGSASLAQEISTSGAIVTARFTAAQVDSAVRAGVRRGAAQDAVGLASIAGDFPLVATASQVGDLDPDLISVANYRLSNELDTSPGAGNKIVVDFTFLDTNGTIAATYAAASPTIGGLFFLIGEESDLYEGDASIAPTIDTSVTGQTTITVGFDADPEDIPEIQLRRAGITVPAGLLLSSTQDVTWIADYAAGGITVDPDLVSVTRDGTSATQTFFRFEFDEAVSATVISDDEFYIVGQTASNISDTVAIASTTAVRTAVAADGARVIRAGFPTADITAAGITPVFGFVNDGAVLATDSTDSDNDGYNRRAGASITVPLVSDPVPGVTEVHDLVSATRIQNVVTGRYSIQLVTNATIAVPAAPDISLYDANGVRFPVTSAATSVAVDAVAGTTTLTWDAATTNLTDDQIAATVTVGVQEVVGGPHPGAVTLTEGQVDARELVVR